MAIALPLPSVLRSRPSAERDATDEALVALVARGDERALAALYDRFGRVAFGLAVRVVRDPDLAADAVQDAFVTVWRKAPRFRPERASARTWILMLVHRRAVDVVRSADRRSRALDRDAA